MKKIYPRKCLNCKEKFIPVNQTNTVCSPKCALEYTKAVKKKKEDKEWKEKKSVLRDKLKTLGQYEAEAKKSFQKWVRMRDTGKPCISCGNKSPKEWHGSHYFDANRFSALIFDERNCHAACDYCNVYLAGNLIGYRKGLIERYGKEYVEQLESESDSKRVYKYTKEELIAKKLKYDILIKEMK